MQRMTPFHLMPVLKAQKVDGNPAVHEDRIHDQVQSRLHGYFNLQQDNDRNEVLPYTEDGPYLNGYELI